MRTHDAVISPTESQRRAFSDWWYLVYLGLLLFQPALDPAATATDWLVTAALGVAGAGLYAVCMRARPGDLVRLTAAFAALGTVGVWFNGGATVFFVYAAAQAGAATPRAVARRWLAGLTGLMVVLAVLSPVPMPYRIAGFAFPIVFIWIVGMQVMDAAEREREAARLRVDAARVERLATLSERERIARDLHDLLGHTLTGIVVRSQLIERIADRDPIRAAQEASDIEAMARDALAEVRATVTGWRHHALDVELDAARDTLAAAGVAMVVQQDAAVSVSPPVEAALALAVREAVTNVVRHAGATTCRVDVRACGDEVELTVADDGTGATGADGVGLSGMRERLVPLGGRVERHGGEGTTVTVTVPAAAVAP